jgi:hypothetical protein
MEGQLHVSATDITHPRIKLDIRLGCFQGPCLDHDGNFPDYVIMQVQPVHPPSELWFISTSRNNGELHSREMQASVLFLATVGTIGWF